ncbi:ubiquitin-conjugating enzyme E2 S [Physocladia obscura]|uniref:E2 ubiquitin-conjugating enzyme n=1 Tax=Physocladia obscura TaxID=109957 RepID=A0AAD5XJ79_9FUNG|nr:ubiquitin-conjugating enzyme E2 S [Physocladia obscura]
MSKAIKAVMRELIHLNTNPPAQDIRLIETPDVLDIQAWMLGPEGTPYAGGCFKVRLVPGQDFPASSPKGYFETKIFHPNVSKTGEICINTLKKDWNPNLGIAHVLLTIRCLLIAPNPESALNDDAGKLLLEDYTAFAKHAALITGIHAKPPSHPHHPFPDAPIVHSALNTNNYEIPALLSSEMANVKGRKSGHLYYSLNSKVDGSGNNTAVSVGNNSIEAVGSASKRRAVSGANDLEKRAISIFPSVAADSDFEYFGTHLLENKISKSLATAAAGGSYARVKKNLKRL